MVTPSSSLLVEPARKLLPVSVCPVGNHFLGPFAERLLNTLHRRHRRLALHRPVVHVLVGDVAVDEADVDRVHEGQGAAFPVDTFPVDTFPVDTFRGRVSQVRLLTKALRPLNCGSSKPLPAVTSVKFPLPSLARLSANPMLHAGRRSTAENAASRPSAPRGPPPWARVGR